MAARPAPRIDEEEAGGLGIPWGGWPIVRPVPAWRPWLLAVVYALALLPLTIAPRHSGNVLSRYMTIEAIVERGELAIERSPILARSGSPDVVKFGTHLYSDKPPVLSAIAAPVYGIVYLSGSRFCGGGYQFVVANLALTWCLVGLASAWTLLSIRRLFQAVPIPPWTSDLLALGFGFASQLLTYAVTFNNHSVAGALATAALATTVLERPGTGQVGSRWLAGFLAALAMVVDLPTGGLMLAGLGVIQLIRVGAIPWAYLGGSLPPLLIHAWLQSMVTGTPLPAEMYPEAFAYPGSYWASPEGIWKERGPRVWFLVEMLVGPQGWLTVTPALAFGLVGVAMTVVRREDPIRPLAVMVGGSVVILLGYYTWGVRRLDFGGASFGVRHLLAITPPVFVLGVIALARIRRWWASVLFLLLMGIGLAYAVAGVRDPWSRIDQRASGPVIHVLQKLVPYQTTGTRH